MSNIVAIVFEKYETAKDSWKIFEDMDENCRLALEDAVIAYRDSSGELHIEEFHNYPGVGAKQGGVIGLVVGTVLTTTPTGGAAGALVGAAIGSTIGVAVEEVIDPGVSKDFVKDVTESVEVGRTVLFVLFSQVVWPDKVLERLEEINGRIVYTSLSDETIKLFEDKLASLGG